MCSQRLHLLIFVWFYIHLLSITSIQCKRQRNLDQHYLHHQNRPISHNNPSKKLPFQNKKFRSFNLKQDDSTDLDKFPIFLRSNVDGERTFSKNEEKLKTPKKRTEIRKWYKTINSTEHDNYPKLYVNSLKSENKVVKNLAINRSSLQQKESSTSVRTGTTFKESDENSKILFSIKRSVKNDFLTNNNEPEEKTLLNLDGPNILGDVEHSQDQDNLVHIRVKRDNPNKNNVIPRFKSDYLEDLAASFPKSEHVIDNPSAIELNSPKFRYKEDLGYQQENMDSGLEDQVLDNRKKRNNYAKMYPESFSIKNKVSRSVSQIASDYQKKNLDASYEYANDNQDDHQTPCREDNKLFDSMLSKVGYVDVNGNDLEEMDQQKGENYASKTAKDLDSNNLYSSEVLQKEQHNDMNLNTNKKSAVMGEAANREGDNEVLFRKTSTRFPGKESHLNAALRDKRGMTPMKKYKLKLKSNKSKKIKKKPKKKKSRKNRKMQLSKMQESLDQLDKVVDDIQVASKAEKKDSTDGRSEVDIANKDISNAIKLEIEVDRSKRNAQNHRKASAKDQELKYFENIREPETVNRNDVSKSKVDRELKSFNAGCSEIR